MTAVHAPRAVTRGARDDDAILGVRPDAVLSPASVEECAEVMAQTARDRLRLGFIGGGTALELGAPPAGLDAVVRTERIARIVEHAPADMVVIAEAGCTLATIQQTVGAHGQRLALDAPWPERATVGGLIATAGFGPLRTRYGTVRDLIIGVTLVRADGEVAHGGGKVVKNVAGFDLPKVACGSLGTLGLIAEAAFRLHPLPETRTTVCAAGIRADAVVRLLAAAKRAQLEPARVVAISRADGDTGELRFDVAFEFEGFSRGCHDQAEKMLGLCRAGDAPAEPLDAAAAQAFWHRHDAVRAAGPLRVRVATLPTRLPAIAPLIAPLIGAAGGFTWYATLGLGFAGGDPGTDLATDSVATAAAVAALGAARAQLVADGGSLVVEAAPPALRAAVDPWGPAPASFAIMQRLKQRFDPEGRLNPGRFVGGL